MKRTVAAVLALVIALPLAAAPKRRAASTPRPPRFLSIQIAPRLEPAPTVADVFAAYDLAVSAGANGNHFQRRWSELEPTPGTFALDSLRADLAYSTRGRGMKILLNLQVINTNRKETPSDLAATPFDAAEMRSRFRALLDSLRTELQTQVAWLAIGNEVDVYLSLNPAERAAWIAFWTDAAAYAKSIAPQLKVGMSMTSGGVDSHLLAMSDIAVFTYYPSEADFRPRPATTATTDLQRMIDVAGTKPIFLQEVGYPSATALGSSEDAQAEFIDTVFDVWARTDRIRFINLFILHDLTPPLCAQAAQYFGIPGAFEQHLCSLGLRHSNGTPKRAWSTLIERARAVDDAKGSTFVIPFGKSMRVDDLTISFVELKQDSRCPRSVVCFWAGLAEIGVLVERGGDSQTVALSTPAGTAKAFGRTITLHDVDPYPEVPGERDPRTYRATISVE